MRQRSLWGRSLSSRVLLIFPLVLTAICPGVGCAEDLGKTRVEIVADPPGGRGPLKVYLEPDLVNLPTPARFKWSFGDGGESSEKVPGLHLFEGGRYDVVLEVTDANGKKYTASITVNAALPG